VAVGVFDDPRVGSPVADPGADHGHLKAIRGHRVRMLDHHEDDRVARVLHEFMGDQDEGGGDCRLPANPPATLIAVKPTCFASPILPLPLSPALMMCLMHINSKAA
jgi:hypothetical protein